MIDPLEAFPRQIGDWTATADHPIEQAVRDMLRADDTLSRSYGRPGSGLPVNLFVAFFRSQRTGRTPHSPKNCLPGAGFEPLESGTVDLPIPGRRPIRISRYLVARGEDRSLVFYWYQSRGRVVGGEFAAKFWLVADAIRYRRSDTALVRVVVPVAGAAENAEHEATGFIQASFSPLLRALSPVP